MGTQHLGDGQHKVGSRGAGWQFTKEFESNNARNQHRNGLAQHRRLSFNATHSPTKHTQTIDHRGVRVSSHDRIGVSLTIADHHHAGKVFNIDLVHDPGAGRNNFEFIKGALPPAQELVALLIAFIFQRNVQSKSLRGAKVVCDHGVVNDKFCWR
ncbi:unannotated protein [freshwater metagenome]|uniref:Unannotated protein n=1 Tax=freshwater metagenome TaxID=449393 RepID=A0A6J7CSI7_9ZZZZ